MPFLTYQTYQSWTDLLRSIVRHKKWWVLLACGIGAITTRSIFGALSGLLFGAVVAIPLEHRAARFCRETDVVNVLSLPVLGTIPVIETHREQQMRRWRRIVLFLLILTAAAISFFIRAWT